MSARPPAAVVMEDDTTYQRQLETFVRCSTEKSIELLKIGEIIAGLPHRRRFLDIGAGGGDLTLPIAQTFAETVIVEPNAEQAAFFRRRSPQIWIHEQPWSEVDLGAERFDLILCSHVLYYIAESDWLPAIEKMYAHLAPKGRIVIVLQSPLGEVADFFRQFARYDVNIETLWGDLIHRYGDKHVAVRYFTNEIWSRNLDDMVEIALFLLIDRRFRTRKPAIRAYLEAHHRVEGGYRLRQDDVLLAIGKG